MNDAFADAAGIDVRRGVPFATPSDGPLHLDLYRPGEGGNTGARRAAVVLLAGDRWRSIERDALVRYALDLADQGYVCVVPQYRGSGTAAFPAALRDVRAAIRWVRASGGAIGVDPDRIGAFGHDAGAHLAALAALAPAESDLVPRPEAVDDDVAEAGGELEAVVGVGGTYTLEHEPETDALTAFLGGDRETSPDAWRRASPSAYLGRTADAQAGKSPPVLLLHGEDDAVAPAMASELFYDLLTEQDHAGDCVVAAGAGHDIHESQRAFTLNWAAGFFDRQLR